MMDGKLTGLLTANHGLTCILSVTPRDGPSPVFMTKTITENGTYRAADEGADGFSEVTADIHTGLLTPHFFDLSGEYVQNGVWTVGSDTVYYSDVNSVNAGELYFIFLGGVVGTRFRSMFSAQDTSVAVEKVTGKTILNVSNPAPYAYVAFTPEFDGFITISKDNAGTANLKTYVFHLVDLLDGNNHGESLRRLYFYEEEHIMKEFWNTIQLVFTAVGGWLGYFLGGCDGLLYTLLAFVVLDYLTGIMCAIVDKKLSSEIGFKGIFKKVLIFVLVGVGHLMDLQILGAAGVLRTAVIFFYLSNEGVSLVENAAHLGLPIPAKLKAVLEQLHDRSEKDGEE